MTLEAITTQIAERCHCDIVLDAFILSQTLFKDVSWLGAGTTKAAVEQRHVLFLEDGGPAYLRKLFTQVFTA